MEHIRVFLLKGDKSSTSLLFFNGVNKRFFRLGGDIYLEYSVGVFRNWEYLDSFWELADFWGIDFIFPVEILRCLEFWEGRGEEERGEVVEIFEKRAEWVRAMMDFMNYPLEYLGGDEEDEVDIAELVFGGDILTDRDEKYDEYMKFLFNVPGKQLNLTDRQYRYLDNLDWFTKYNLYFKFMEGGESEKND